MNRTANYNLKKPESSDFYNIADFNDNADAIDAALSGKAEVSDLSVTLKANGWAANKQTVEVEGMTASSRFIGGANMDSWAEATSCGLYPSAKGTGALTFTVDEEPENDLVVNIMFIS